MCGYCTGDRSEKGSGKLSGSCLCVASDSSSIQVPYVLQCAANEGSGLAVSSVVL